MHKVALWAGFGIAVRVWQLGIEMRPFFNRGSLWVYPVYAGVGGSFGYWLMGVEQRQVGWLADRREKLLEKRRRRAERDGIVLDAEGLKAGEKKSLVQSIKDTVTGGDENDKEGLTGVELKPEEGRIVGDGKLA